MADPAKTAPPTSDIGKPDFYWGGYGQSVLGDWWETSADLLWPQSVITYGRMRTDPQLKAVLNAYFLPIIRANWAVVPDGCKPDVVQKTADTLGIQVLGDEKPPGPARRRGVIWQRHLRQALLYLVYGHMGFERRYEVMPDGLVSLDNLGERPPWTVAWMEVNSDGTMKNLLQTTQREPIPASRLAWYVNQQIGSNWAGESILRPAFGAWLLKHEGWRTNATSVRRFGMGVPMVEAPPGATAQQVLQAQQMASAMRVGDQSGVGLPAGFKASLMGLSGGAPDTLGWIKYLDTAMAKMAMTALIELGQTETGSRALGDTFLDLFLLSLQAVADEIAVTATSGHPGMPGIVTDFVDQNWGVDEPAPRIACLDLGENYDVTSTAIQQLVVCGAITPDATLDAEMRKRWQLPKRTTPWVPSSRGLPAGTAVTPAAEKGQLANEEAQGEPIPGATLPAKTASFAASRKQADYITASGWDPEAHQADWENALASLLLTYRNVYAAQRTDLVDQVVAALEGGKAAQLALNPPPTGTAADLVTGAMQGIALQAAHALIAEAASQGVRIDLERVRVDARRLGGVASARTSVAASYLAQQASSKALQVYGPGPEGFLAAADEVDRFLAGLSDRTLRDQLGAALTAAQNAGRIAVLEAAPTEAGEAHYVAAEFLDANTCDHCRAIDGTDLGTLEEAEAQYPTGGYKDCEGLMRCRGTVLAVWPEAGGAAPKAPPPVTAGSRADAKFNPAETRDDHGRWGVGEELKHLAEDVKVNPSGRKAAQTPSQFTHPDTGHAMGKTEIGDTFEALFEANGAHLLESKYGGPYRVISGETREGGGRGARNTPLDFALDHKRAGELKTLNSRAANQKTAIKREEVARKEAAARAAGMEPLLVVQVVDPATGRVEVYAWPAFASKTTKAMEHLGGYTFTMEDFRRAQEKTGHWSKRLERAR